MALFSIGGAGIAGLTAGINLSKNGHEVVIHETNEAVGVRPITFQGLRTWGCSSADVIDKIRQSNITFNFKYKELKNQEVVLNDKKSIEVKLTPPIFIVQRGGKDSIEYSLFEQAKRSGVEFKFNSDANKKSMNVMSTGPSRTDGAVAGAVYEGVDFKEDTVLLMFDDRFSPWGLYSYILPHGGGRVEVMNCCSGPWAPQVKGRYTKLVSQHPRFIEILEGANKLYDVGGRGNFFIPKTANQRGTLYTGEAAGFQDPFMGYGIIYAMRSGFLAALSLMDGRDYDELWRAEFLPSMKEGLALRFFTSIFGGQVINKFFENGGGSTPGVSPLGEILKNPLFVEVFSNLQMLRSSGQYL